MTSSACCMGGSVSWHAHSITKRCGERGGISNELSERIFKHSATSTERILRNASATSARPNHPTTGVENFHTNLTLAILLLLSPSSAHGQIVLHRIHKKPVGATLVRLPLSGIIFHVPQVPSEPSRIHPLAMVPARSVRLSVETKKHLDEPASY